MRCRRASPAVAGVGAQVVLDLLHGRGVGHAAGFEQAARHRLPVALARAVGLDDVLGVGGQQGLAERCLVGGDGVSSVQDCTSTGMARCEGVRFISALRTARSVTVRACAGSITRSLNGQTPSNSLSDGKSCSRWASIVSWYESPVIAMTGAPSMRES